MQNELSDADWVRDTAMNVMLATEVDEATRILSLALSLRSRSQSGGVRVGSGWFKLSGDARLGRCATDDCGGQPTYRLEADGIGANYCSGCAAKAQSALEPSQEQGEPAVSERQADVDDINLPIEEFDPRPANCRQRLREEGKAYPRSSCTACGASIGKGLGLHCTRGLYQPTVDASLRGQEPPPASYKSRCASPQPAVSGVTVTDEMVERAAKAMWEAFPGAFGGYPWGHAAEKGSVLAEDFHRMRTRARAALTAALSQEGEG